MIKDLRRKFVLIIMTLVSAVLIIVLGGSYISSWQSQHDMVTQALQRGIDGSLSDLPRIGMPPKEERGEQRQRGGILVLAVDLDQSGALIATNQAPVIIDSSALSEILDYVLQSEDDYEWDDSLHLAWQRQQRSSGSWRVVIADTSDIDSALESLAVKQVAIILAAIAVLLLISIGLSTWVLRPVELAWEQQRQFVADASHELKTPLAVISANMQILAADKTLPAESSRWVQSTVEETSHMKSLVEELLELARTDEGSRGNKSVMQQDDVDFSSLVENASLEFDAIAFERGTSIEESIADGVHVKGDPEWLGRLCKILIDNATKYSKGTEPVTVSLTQEAHRCTLKVNNHGDVISPHDLEHLFDRFYRTDKARSRNNRTGGFGLGLAIAKGIATSHKGSIAATSTESEGTTFCVTLPTTGQS